MKDKLLIILTRTISENKKIVLMLIGQLYITGVSLTFSPQGQLVFTGGPGELNFFYEKYFPINCQTRGGGGGGQNHPHSQSICPVPSP